MYVWSKNKFKRHKNNKLRWLASHINFKLLHTGWLFAHDSTKCCKMLLPMYSGSSNLSNAGPLFTHSVSLTSLLILLCPRFDELCQDLFRQLFQILNKNALNLDSRELCHLMLYGSSSLSMKDNRMIIKATIQHLENSERFK